MKSDKLKQLEQRYELELDSVLESIIKKKAKSVLLQFPEGLKQYGLDIIDYLEEELKQQNKEVEFRVWGGACFGACDVPETECDLIIQFGHAKWKY